MGEVVQFVVISWLCSLVFILIGIFSIQKKTPMHFWAGTTVKSEKITDIKSYNKANGVMWISYGLTYVLAGLISLLFNTFIGSIILILSNTVGVIALIIAYIVIYNKYKA